MFWLWFTVIFLFSLASAFAWLWYGMWQINRALVEGIVELHQTIVKAQEKRNVHSQTVQPILPNSRNSPNAHPKKGYGNRTV